MQYGSLRKALIKRLSLTLGLSLLLLIPLLYFLVQRPAVKAYDIDLSDATRSLIPSLQIVNGKAQFTFPQAAEDILRTDSHDNIYYLVLGPGEQFIAGDQGLPLPDPAHKLTKPLLYNAVYLDHDVRVSAIPHNIDGQQFIFLTAETTKKRQLLAFNTTIATIVSLLVLIIVSTINVWYSTNQALVPLDKIRKALHGMQHHNLEALDENLVPTEIKPLVQEFNSLLQRLDASAEGQQRFVANAAHQLRTPLAGVQTQLELLRDETNSQIHEQRITQSIHAIERLAHLVHQMLALLSSVPGGRETSVQTLVNISDVIRERSTEWVHLATPRMVDLGFELETVHVYGDSLLIGEMIANLVDNALRYSPIGSIVTVRCRQQDALSIIEVEDNGPGIPTKERELVFERFYRSAAFAAISGSGLGLAIAREVVYGLNGSIRIETPSSGKGCLIVVECPAPATKQIPMEHTDILATQAV
ncbi:sensor histidine kinase [Herminiimonas arsenitoxidans]|uniref:sensor histidine kinase n=1 Tax=Herminiimonas arsenitoxidans TaxID=1809410 RepID=UPI000970536A|nr:sensor histidine kinase [Herminiimonas arsenitoxidans]